MALSDINATPEQLEQLAVEQKRLKSELKQQRDLELARADGPYTHLDPEGTLWGYSTIDASFVRIDSCQTNMMRLAVPESIDGMPVLAIGAGAFASLETIEEIACPPAIASIGPGAFQICPNLRRVVLPACVDEFDPSWLQRCGKLEELTLPGRLEAIPRTVFDYGRLKRLYVGTSAYSLEPGAFERSELDFLQVNPANPHIASDGIGLYTADGAMLIAICRQVVDYRIADGCSRIAAKAAYGLRGLKQITIPASMCEIGELAFARSGIECFKAPASLQTIGAKAFYQCTHLEDIQLNEGLIEIGDSAFEGSAIDTLEVPGSIESIGRAIVRNTDVRFTGTEARFSIAPSSDKYVVDAFGGLYRREDTGFVLEGLLDDNAVEYQVTDGTVAIAAKALLRHPSIERAWLPDGVNTVGESAFRSCKRLKRVELPNSLTEIGPEAFADTTLESIRIPPNLSSIGDFALAITGTRKIGPEPVLRHIEVDPDNKVFEVVDGLLCERRGNGSRVIAFDNTHAHVRFPEDVVEVASYALGNAHGIRELWLNSSLARVGIGGLMVWSSIERLHVNLQEPIEGRTEFDFTFPATTEAIQAASNALSGFGFVNVQEIARLCDKSILNCHNYVRPVKGQPSAYDQARLMVARLEDPVLMDEVDRMYFGQTIERHLEAICIDIARHDDRTMFDKLADLGFLSGDNIESVVSAVARLEDAATTSHLLEMKRRRFQTDPFDFSI